MASPIIFRCRKIGFRFFFRFATPKDWRDQLNAYTSNMLVFYACLPPGNFLEIARMNRKTKILIVEDDTPLAMMMVSLLTRAGCDVQTAWNAEKTMRLAQDEDFDLITLDVDLPRTNGFEICSRLKDNFRSCDTPVVFFSARLHEEDQQRAFELGAVDYISKPFQTLEFAARLLSHIKRQKEFA